MLYVTYVAVEGGKKNWYKENQSQLLFPGASRHGVSTVE